jgi:hypothetical protein
MFTKRHIMRSWSWGLATYAQQLFFFDFAGEHYVVLFGD